MSTERDVRIEGLQFTNWTPLFRLAAQLRHLGCVGLDATIVLFSGEGVPVAADDGELGGDAGQLETGDFEIGAGDDPAD